MVSTNTRAADPSLEAALSAVLEELRTPFLSSYKTLKAAFSQSRHDICGLQAGKFSETMLRLLQHSLTGSFIPLGTHIGNFEEECLKLQRLPRESGCESFRIIIPRALSFLYTLRNKRGIGHVGGAVDANPIDSATCARLSDWCVSELIRVTHTLSLEDAQALLDAIAVRQLPAIWTAVNGKKRVLAPDLDYRAQTLLLLYAQGTGAALAQDLFNWTEHSYLPSYRRDVLRALHQLRLVEYDRVSEMVSISPLGARQVEEKILPSIQQ